MEGEAPLVAAVAAAADSSRASALAYGLPCCLAHAQKAWRGWDCWGLGVLVFVLRGKRCDRLFRCCEASASASGGESERWRRRAVSRFGRKHHVGRRQPPGPRPAAAEPGRPMKVPGGQQAGLRWRAGGRRERDRMTGRPSPSCTPASLRFASLKRTHLGPQKQGVRLGALRRGRLRA